ncbi:glutamine-dependent NAD(+) synthetase isoform X2 [Iris pallida]|uniref:Glutamine-dependent NAD(+) synthetase isoform X2 n=1 Tax=Iris pallida TaxID=29817 RepID=A0AAX6FSG7_IRIPA|nr:glutamine-dependent NAD(+) synthetase isoform X2 [Iris pallida]
MEGAAAPSSIPLALDVGGWGLGLASPPPLSEPYPLAASACPPLVSRKAAGPFQPNATTATTSTYSSPIFYRVSIDSFKIGETLNFSSLFLLQTIIKDEAFDGRDL